MKSYVMGIDFGSTTAKTVVLDLKGNIVSSCVAHMGAVSGEGVKNSIEGALKDAGITQDDIGRTVSTGYGRRMLDIADKNYTEITCHARGAVAMMPETRLVIDIGGQDSKVIRISQSGKVIDFAMNDKCAAGTGRFLQVTAAALGLAVDELDNAEDRALEVEISSMCAVFAESEIIGLLASGVSKGGIIAGLHRSIGKRVATMARSLGVGGQIAFTGGVALNRGIQRALSEELGQPVQITEYCQFVGALGAAMLARTC